MDDVAVQLTAEDIEQAVRDAVTSSPVPVHDATLDQLQSQVDGISQQLTQLLGQRDAIADTEQVYTVRADSSQVEVAKSGIRVLCTEGMLIVVLLSVIVGLQFFSTFASKWGRS